MISMPDEGLIKVENEVVIIKKKEEPVEVGKFNSISELPTAKIHKLV